MKIPSFFLFFAIPAPDRDLHWSPRLALRLGNIGRWPLPVRIAAWSAVCMLGAGLGGILLVLPSWRALTAAEEENRLLSEKLEQQQRILAPLRNGTAERKAMRTQYEAWLDDLPQEVNATTLLQALDKAARERGIAMRRLAPGQIKNEPEYDTLPLAAELEGEYVALADFIRTIALLPWPVTIEKLSMMPVPGIPGQLRLQLGLHYRQLRRERKDKP